MDEIRFHVVRFVFQVLDQIIPNATVIAAATGGCLVLLLVVFRSRS